jgi:broad specificity phosphatase PhoE
MPKLMVIRHSLAEANEQGILMGTKLDSPLSEMGKHVALQKGEALKAEKFFPDKVFTSKLARAKQTAEIILTTLGISVPIIELVSLNERDFGKYDGKPYKYVLEAFKKEGDNPETVEPNKAFVSRVLEGYEQIRRGTTGTTLVVTHSNPEIVMQNAALNPDYLEKYWELGDPAYCEGFTYEF